MPPSLTHTQSMTNEGTVLIWLTLIVTALLLPKNQVVVTTVEPTTTTRPPYSTTTETVKAQEADFQYETLF